MKMNSYKVIGVMSGTSVDGVDLCAVQFDFDGKWQYDILHSATSPYPDNWRSKLLLALELDKAAIDQLNIEYTRHLAEHIKEFIQEYQITAIDAVCSHGHTIFHQPDKGITLQIGNLPEIADLLNCTVVCDFRTQDVKLGGQGAPLVPIGDRLLFGEYDICLNLGGFSNVSFERDNERNAFDICPVNSVLNRLARELDLSYDDKGNIARTGLVHTEMLNALNRLQFYGKPPPKSLGMEWVEQQIVPVIQQYDCSIEDKLRTFVEHIAIQIAAQLNPLSKQDILVTGGGAYNDFLINRMKAHNTADIVLPSNELIDYKEALIFGFLGVLRLRNEPNCLSSVTGAAKDHSSGLIYSS